MTFNSPVGNRGGAATANLTHTPPSPFFTNPLMSRDLIENEEIELIKFTF